MLGIPVCVTSLAEVWIEMAYLETKKDPYIVTSLAEVWIEINVGLTEYLLHSRHFPCGSVD